jgi:hypothetical protein
MTSATLAHDRPGPFGDDVRRRALAVAKGIALAPFAVLFTIFIVIFPAGVGIKAAIWAFGTGSVVLETAVVVVLVASMVAALWWSIGRGGIKALLRFGRFEPILRASALACFAAVTFTTLTALLFEQGLIGITPAPAKTDVLDETFDFYLWHLANTVPLVDIPGNLEWSKPFEFDDALGGLLVIVFTGFVIFPLIQLARLILDGGDVPYEVAVVRALGKHVGSERIFVVRDHEGYGRAIVDDWLFVDVMRGVWNHDAAQLRLEQLAARDTVKRPHGYLLVVDAIAEPARERVEAAMDDAPFPAALAVWRSDQRVADLTGMFGALEKQVTAPAS